MTKVTVAQNLDNPEEPTVASRVEDSPIASRVKQLRRKSKSDSVKPEEPNQHLRKTACLTIPAPRPQNLSSNVLPIEPDTGSENEEEHPEFNIFKKNDKTKGKSSKNNQPIIEAWADGKLILKYKIKNNGGLAIKLVAQDFSQGISENWLKSLRLENGDVWYTKDSYFNYKAGRMTLKREFKLYKTKDESLAFSHKRTTKFDSNGNPLVNNKIEYRAPTVLNNKRPAEEQPIAQPEPKRQAIQQPITQIDRLPSPAVSNPARKLKRPETELANTNSRGF